MRRFLILVLTAVLLISAIPMVYAADSSEGTDIVLKGTYATETYTITVPSKLAPGETGTVTLTGGWNPTKTIKVSCPNSVTLTYEGQSINVGINFNGITQTGSISETFDISETISVEKKTAAFGTWTGHLEYIVEVIEDTTGDDSGGTPVLPTLISFTINGIEYQAEEEMTWSDWVESDYNPDAYETYETNDGDDTITVKRKETNYVVYRGERYVSIDDVIVADEEYIHGIV